MPDQIAIIVPTMNRSHLLQGLLDSIHEATSTSHQVYFMVEQGDKLTRAAVEELKGRHVVFQDTFGCYVAAANEGVRRTREPYLIVINDDVKLHPGWDTAALEAMRDPIRVVGIDQGNGRTDCFFLVDRRYVKQHGFYFEGYRSQFCDTEFYDRARARGVWADAQGALIEHMHWTFGKSEMDANYEMAVASVEADQGIYQERGRQWQA